MNSLHDDLRIASLTFPAIAYGKQETPWDLSMLLYRGGASARRDEVWDLIDARKLGDPLPERLELVQRIHEVINDRLDCGGSPHTVNSTVERARYLFGWAELAGHPLTLDTIEATYLCWTDALDHRCRVACNLSQRSAYQTAALIGKVLDRALGRLAPLILTTRLSRPPQRKTARGVQAEKQNLQDTFAFGHFMQDICDGLPIDVVLKSPLPVRIPLRMGGELVHWSGYPAYKARMKLNDRILNTPQRRYHAKNSDECWATFESDGTLRTRYPLANLRIIAELHMFIGQTGMNLAQAHQLKLRHFWYASHLDGYQVKDRKLRRGGEVLFEIYREYKPHFERYLAWSQELFPDSDLLFPLVIIHGRAEKTAPSFDRMRGIVRSWEFHTSLQGRCATLVSTGSCAAAAMPT